MADKFGQTLINTVDIVRCAIKSDGLMDCLIRQSNGIEHESPNINLINMKGTTFYEKDSVFEFFGFEKNYCITTRIGNYNTLKCE